MNNGDKPASPLDSTAEFDVVKGYTFDMCGLTKREAFAMAAMQGMIRDISQPQTACSAVVAKLSVCFADALLKALEQS